VDIGFFDIGDSFHKERFYIQINSPTAGNDFGNNEYFRDNVWKKFGEIESFRVGSREILDQNDVRKTQKENSILREKNSKFVNILKLLNEKIEKQKYSNDILELEKLEKELKEVSSTILEKKPISENVETKNISKAENSLVWNGKNIRDFGVKAKDFETFVEFVKGIIDFKAPSKNANFSKSLEPKDEFETDLEFQKREKKFELEKRKFELDYKRERDNQISEIEKEVENSKSEIFNSYLGKQSIEMKYLAEKSEFEVSVNSILHFQIEVSRNIAREFKAEIKSFDFGFSENLVLETIQTKFQGKEFFGKGFKKDILEEIERERIVQEITEWSKRFGLGLPKSWKELQELKEIKAQDKRITYIPEAIGNLSNLKELSFSYNKLTEIPEAIGNLSNLKELSFRYNQITEIPEAIGNLSNLETLSFCCNKETTEIPEAIGNLSNLETLDFRYNNISNSEKEKLKRVLPNTRIWL
jgi:Leucine-rich repeat (LRR) protein